MTNITTGNISGSLSLSRFRKPKEDEEKSDAQFKMDDYNSGLIFGSDKELAATRINQQQQRKLLVDWKHLESERIQCLRGLAANHSIMSIKNQDLENLKKHFFTNLEPIHYNELSRLYNQGKLKPIRTECIRVNSAKLIAEKARQLGLINVDGRRSAPIPGSSRSNISRRTNIYFDNKKHGPTMHISNQKKDFSDNIEIDDYGRRTRIIEADGWKRVVPLILESRIPNAVNIKNPEVITKDHIQMVQDERRSTKIHHLDINLQALGAEYNSVSFKLPETSCRDGSPLYQNNKIKIKKPKSRSLSAHPKLSTKSSQINIAKETEISEGLSKKVDSFCRSFSALK